MRVTENLIVRNFLQRTAGTLSDMARAQEKISSGKKLLRPSDDPRALAKSLSVRSDLRRVATYADNASSAAAFMSLTETSMQEVSDLLSRAKDLVLEGANATSDGSARKALSLELRAMVDEMMLIANREVGGRSLFSGHQTRTSPYVRISDRVLYQGDGGEILEELGPGLRVAVNLTGPDAFQTVPSRLQGDVDLDPAVSTVTPLADLYGGTGVLTGQIRLTDSNGVTADVDLLAAENVGQILEGINTAGTSIVASIALDGSGILLTDTGGGTSFQVEDIEGGTLANSLGLTGEADAGTTIIGANLDPAVTDNTPMATLLRGAGIAPGTWTLRNSGEDENLWAVIDPSQANTVGDLIAMIDEATTQNGEWLGIRASVEGSTLRLQSVRLHTTLTVSDAPGGSSASTLGVSGSGRAEHVFGLLESAANGMLDGDQDVLEQMIDTLTSAIEQTAGARGTYGARARQVLAVAANLADQNVDLTLRLADVEDADLAKAAVELAMAETVYNASLATGTKFLSLSLFNYIR